jgi:hypothetical protein
MRVRNSDAPHFYSARNVHFSCIGVHRGILALPQTIPIRIYVKPYVRKYVLVRLC